MLGRQGGHCLGQCFPQTLFLKQLRGYLTQFSEVSGTLIAFLVLRSFTQRIAEHLSASLSQFHKGFVRGDPHEPGTKFRVTADFSQLNAPH
jgi:hypothetical protein